MCELLDLPRKTMAEEGLTIEEALTEPGVDGIGLRAEFALLGPGEASGAQRFRPALRYLSERWTAESLHGDTDPEPPSASVIENAHALDAFLADGGCG